MAQCYSDTIKQCSTTGNLNFYYGAFQTVSVSGVIGDNKMSFNHFPGESARSGHRRTYTDVGLQRNLDDISRPMENSSQMLINRVSARDTDLTRSSIEFQKVNRKLNIGDHSKAAAGMLGAAGDNSRKITKRDEIDRSTQYDKIIPNFRSSSERSSEERNNGGDLIDAEQESQRRLKENIASSKIRSIPRPQGTIVNAGDDNVPGRSIRPENSNGWASIGGFAVNSLQRDRTVENKASLVEGEPKITGFKSLNTTGELIQFGKSDEPPPQNQRTRLRSRNLSEGNFSRYFGGEDMKRTSNELKIHTGSPSRSKSWNTLASSNSRLALGPSGGGMYTGESSRWGTGLKSKAAEDSHSSALSNDGASFEPNNRVTSSKIVSLGHQFEGGSHPEVYGAGQLAQSEKTANGKQSVTSSKSDLVQGNVLSATITNTFPGTQTLSSKSNAAEDGNRGHSSKGDLLDAQISSKSSNDGRNHEKDSFANSRSNASTDQRSLTARGPLIVGNSVGRSDARSSLDANMSTSKTNSKPGNGSSDGDHLISGRPYAANGFIHPKQENFPNSIRSEQHKRVKSTDGVFGNISNTNILAGKDHAEEFKRMGNEKYKKGRFAEALALYERAISLAPTQASYHSNRAAALSALGRLVNAVQECKEAIRLDPSYTRARRRLASLFLRLGQIDDAKRYLKSFGEHFDTGDLKQVQKIEGLLVRCLEAKRVNDWRTLLRESDETILAGADSAPKVLALKAEALINLHRPDEVAELLSSAQKLEADLISGGYKLPDGTVSVVQAQFLMSQGRHPEALIAAEKAARIHPKDVELSKFLKKLVTIVKARNTGNRLFKEGKYFEACAAYGEGLEVDPTNAVLLCNRAACRFSIGLWEKSIEDCDAALAAQPTYTKARLRRAHSYAKLEKWEETLQDFEAVKRELPGNVEVAQALFDAQVQLHKSRGEKVLKAHFGAEVQRISSVDQFRKAVTSPGLVVVVFVIRGNDRCKRILPFVDKLCQDYPTVNFVMVDIDEIPYLANLEKVGDVPRVKIFRSGQKVQELQDLTHEDLEHALQSYTQ